MILKKPSIPLPVLFFFCLLSFLLAPGSARADSCLSLQSGTWESSDSWSCGHAPAAGDSATIQSGHTVTLSSAAGSWDVDGVTVEAGGTLALARGLRVTGSNSGVFSVSGTLQLNAGGSVVLGIAPTYQSGATLRYSSGGSSNRGNEWGSGDSGAGVPYHVAIATNTSLSLGSGRTVRGTLTIDSGSTLQAPTTQLKIKGDWVNNGTFVHNGSTVVFSTDGQTSTLSGSSNTVFNRIQVTSSSTLNAGTTNLTVAGSSFQVTGTFNGGSATATFDAPSTSIDLDGTGSYNFNHLTIASSTTLLGKDAGNSTISVAGTWTNHGAYTPNGGTVAFVNAASGQSLGGSSATTFHNLQVANGSAAGLTLAQNSRVNGTLTLGNATVTTGRVTVGDNTLTLGPSAQVLAGSGSLDSQRMLIAEGPGSAEGCTGRLAKEYSGTGSFTFPLGEDEQGSTDYAPATISFTQGTFSAGQVRLCVTDLADSTRHPQDAQSNEYVTRYWTVDQSGISNFAADVTFTYQQADVVGTESAIFGAKYDTGSGWLILEAVDAASNQITGSVTSFSDFYGGSATLPVTLAWVRSERHDGAVTIDWQTATETGNVAFNLYAESAQGLERLNAQPILSRATDSTTPYAYRYTTRVLPGSTFYIEDVDLMGRSRRHGPFTVGQSHGRAVEPEAIDWAAIRAEHDAKAAARAQAGVRLGQSPSEALLHLIVEADGLQRVSYEQFLESGLDLQGVATADLALLNEGVPVALTVGGPDPFGPGSFVEFYGVGLDTLYSKQNVYTLYLDPSLALRVENDASPVTGSAATAYLERSTVADNLLYDVVASTDDPWYQARLVATGGPVTRSFTVQVDGYVAGAAPASLRVELWGGTLFAATPDHHVQLALNGSALADVTWDGIAPYTVDVPLPEGLLQEGSNLLSITLPHDLGVMWDVVGLESYAIRYPRAFVARPDGLTFVAAGEQFRVTGVSSPTVLVYRLDERGSHRLLNLEVTPTGDHYEVAFAGSAEASVYVLTPEEALATPTLVAARPPVDITSGTADYVIVTHPDFIESLAPLVAFHQQAGRTVRVVNVEDVYEQFAYALFEPEAIKRYLQHAHASMGTEYVLLVGGDSYDYHDYKGLGSISFLPSLYASTGNIVRFAPLDPLYADVDGDLVPDLKIGRLPVRTSAELDALIANLLAYQSKAYTQSALFAADLGYSPHADALLASLPPEWQVDTAYLDETPVAEARSALIAAINEGVALTGFFGHSGPTAWTFSGLFSAADASALSNTDKPTVVAQFGCWNNYYVSPTYNTLAHSFLLADRRGAVALLGAVTLTEAPSDRLLGDRVMGYLAEPGTTIGEALHLAKQQLALDHPGLLDAQLGYTILGDPALMVSSEAPLGILLADFSATPTGSGIALRWETVSEWDNLGFNLYRSTDPNTVGEALNSELIPSQGPGSGQGFVYEWVDESAQPDIPYFYWLEDLSLSGATTLHGPVTATLAWPTVLVEGELSLAGGGPAPFLPPLTLLVSVVALAGLRRAWHARGIR